jgi:hypothetical protein
MTKHGVLAWVCVCGLTGVGSQAAAQDLVASKAAYGLDEGTITPMEIDGDPSTRDFLQVTYRQLNLALGNDDYTMVWRGIIMRPAGWCLGEFYDPWEDVWAAWSANDAHPRGEVRNVGIKHKFVMQSWRSYMEFDIRYGCGT